MKVEWEADLVGIDYLTRQTIVGLTITASESLVDRVWVWAYFVNPNFSPEGSWSDEPKEVVGPFDPGRPTAVAFGIHCSWCTNPDTPPSGYFARVNVSAVSAEDARIPTIRRRYGPNGAIPVVVADTGVLSSGMVRHPELASYAPALGKTAFEKATGRELGQVEDVGYRDLPTGGREKIYLVLYRGGIRPVPVAGTRLSETASVVANRVTPAVATSSGVGSVEELEASPFIRSRAFGRVDVRRLAEGEFCYTYRTSTRPELLLELSFGDGALASAAVMFEGERVLDSNDFALISELFTTLRPSAPVGDDVLDYVRVTVGDDLTRVLPSPPYAFLDLLVEANTRLGAPIVSLKRPARGAAT